MTGEDIIRQVQYKYAEHIEMEDDPATFVAGILANQIVNLKGHIEYLERRVESYVRTTK